MSRISVVLLTAVVAIGCGRSSSTEKLTITGSSTVAPLVSEIAKRYEAAHPGVQIDVQTGGTGKGIADVRQGIAGIGMASRNLKPDEDDLTAHALASDGVGMIVHAENGVGELTQAQILQIYRNEVNNWQELGGENLPIQVVHKAEGRATLEVFLNHFQIENPSIQPDVIVGHNEQGIKTVAGARGSIGYVSIGTAEANIEAGVPIKLLPLEGIEATTETVASGSFPMSRPLLLITQGELTPVAADFLKFAQSEEVHDLIRENYFVPSAR
ncbi:phosphate ABC transporter substrate-binding protein [Bremerella sp. T1]|uniref:phosphate ABC transporter substrate-binding protein n=1 Tax=Bremerella sp. TYQ1 TaxID=3119568 RepID=UPI001CCDFB05|nr:phosphate ABC transporter substrate-binding protein [Bremerella volcania]UBM38329.1 phosphate ABC transporter substrate-binding protein [Bremerella volcania]